MIGTRDNSLGWMPGDWVIYRKSKVSSNPGVRASRVVANSKGETYGYCVDKYWVVERVLDDNLLRLRTPGGKVHDVSADDPNLRRPSLLDRLFWRDRFQTVERQLQIQRENSGVSPDRQP